MRVEDGSFLVTRTGVPSSAPPAAEPIPAPGVAPGAEGLAVELPMLNTNPPGVGPPGAPAPGVGADEEGAAPKGVDGGAGVEDGWLEKLKEGADADGAPKMEAAAEDEGCCPVDGAPKIDIVCPPLFMSMAPVLGAPKPVEPGWPNIPVVEPLPSIPPAPLAGTEAPKIGAAGEGFPNPPPAPNRPPGAVTSAEAADGGLPNPDVVAPNENEGVVAPEPGFIALLLLLDIIPNIPPAPLFAAEEEEAADGAPKTDVPAVLFPLAMAGC